MKTELVAVYYAIYQGMSVSSRVISAKTNSRDTHVSIFLPDLETVIEAWGGGVTKSHWTENHTPTTPLDIFWIPCAEEQRDMFYKFAELQIGKEYDYNGVFSLGLSFLRQDKDKLFCSELWQECNLAARIDVLDIEPYLCTPRDSRMVPKHLKFFVESRVIPGELPEHKEVKTIND